MTKEEIIEMAGHRQVSEWVIKLVGDAVAKEREECAKEVENVLYGQEGCGKATKAIRSRGKE